MEFLYFIEGIRFPALTGFMSAITYLGDELCFMAISILFLWCINKRVGFYIFIVGLYGTFINQFMKLWFRIPRPWILDPELKIVESAVGAATGYSFPSGHTQNSVGTFASLAISTDKKWLRWLALVLLILVPFSRMYLGVHTPLDVSVAFLTAVALSIGLYFCFRNDAVFEKSIVYVLAGLITLAAAYALFVFCYEFPADIDPHNMSSGVKNACTVGGTSLAFVFVYFYDKKKLNFSTEAPLLGQILKFVLGLALVIAIKSGAKPVLNALFGLFLNETAAVDISNFFRYFLITVFAGAIWPRTFPFFARMGKK